MNLTKTLKLLIPKYIQHKVNILKKQIKNYKILTFEYSQFISIKRGECVDRHLEPTPWYTYPTIEYLSNLDFTNKTVFEYGCGNSSLWWSRRAKMVVSVEDNQEWYEKVKITFKNNNKIFLAKDKDSYVSKIAEENVFFDVIIIDGKYRFECSKLAGNYLNKAGMMILDNSDWYPKTAKYIREHFDLIQVDLHGFGPINDYTWTTSLFLSRNFNFLPIGSQPHLSRGGLPENDEENN